MIIEGGKLELTTQLHVPHEVDLLVDSTHLFSARVLKKVEDFKLDPHAAAIIFKDVPLGNDSSISLNSSSASRWILASITKLFGYPVGYEELESKAFFKDIFTGSGETSSYISNYTPDASHRTFGWHVENLAHPHMPRYVLMLCLKQDDQKVTETIFVSGEAVARKLSPHIISILKQKRFILEVEDTLNLDNISFLPEPIAVLSEEPSGAWLINLDSTFLRPANKEDGPAQFALEEILRVAEDSFETVKLETGDIIIWDNTKVAHDRQFGGSNRWLMRTHAYTGNISPFRLFHNVPVQYMEGDPHVIKTKGVFHEVFRSYYRCLERQLAMLQKLLA